MNFIKDGSTISIGLIKKMGWKLSVYKMLNGQFAPKIELNGSDVTLTTKAFDIQDDIKHFLNNTDSINLTLSEAMDLFFELNKNSIFKYEAGVDEHGDHVVAVKTANNQYMPVAYLGNLDATSILPQLENKSLSDAVAVSIDALEQDYSDSFIEPLGRAYE